MSTGLWRETEFGKLWAASTISSIGFHVTVLAMQLTAAVALDATPIQMGLLVAAESVPVLLLSLATGVWVDRVRRRPLLIAADVGRAALLAWVPVAWLAGWLRIEQLYVVAFGVGALTTVFDIAAPAYLPRLVGRERLLPANAALQAGTAAVNVAAPNVAGLLVQVLTAPIALVATVGTYVASALGIAWIRQPEGGVAADTATRSVVVDAREGIGYLFGHRLLRPLVLTSAVYGFFQGMRAALVVLYLTGPLGLEPIVLGLVWGVAGAGAVLGASVAGRVARAIGIGPALVAAYLVGPFNALTPAAGLVPDAALALLVVGHFGSGFWGPVYGVNAATLLQSQVDDRLLGRVLASDRFVYRGVAPLGALAGGVIGDVIGLQSGLVLAAIGATAGVVWLVRSPVAGLRSVT